jgi:membrane protein DedA with SNARE-associated domain
MLTYLAASPGPVPGPAHQDRSGLAVLAVLIVLAVVATIWIRRAASRYRRRLHGGN